MLHEVVINLISKELVIYIFYDVLRSIKPYYWYLVERYKEINAIKKVASCDSCDNKESIIATFTRSLPSYFCCLVAHSSSSFHYLQRS